MNEVNRALSSASLQFCACCKTWKQCRLYALQNGEAEWVCSLCRGDEKKPLASLVAVTLAGSTLVTFIALTLYLCANPI